MKNKKGVGPFGAVLLFIIFVVIWFIWLAGWLTEQGRSIVENNNLTGIEAFFYSNLNLLVMIFLVLGIIGYMYFGAAQG